MIDKLVGKQVWLRRAELGLSEAGLAGLLRVSVEELAAYETGARRIDAELLRRVSLVLKSPLPYFFAPLRLEGKAL